MPPDSTLTRRPDAWFPREETMTNNNDKYYRPDRSDRPGSTNDPMIGRTTEVAPSQDKGGTLRDGRPFVVEVYGVDGYTMAEYWFDHTGLEDAEEAELLELLRGSGIHIPPFEVNHEEGSILAKPRSDAQDRLVWVVTITWDPSM